MCGGEWPLRDERAGAGAGGARGHGTGIAQGTNSGEREVSACVTSSVTQRGAGRISIVNACRVHHVYIYHGSVPVSYDRILLVCASRLKARVCSFTFTSASASARVCTTYSLCV